MAFNVSGYGSLDGSGGDNFGGGTGSSGYGNNYTADQINSAYAQLLNSGTSVQDIITGAKNNFGIGADQMIAAQHARDPNQQAVTDNQIRSMYGDSGAQAAQGGMGGGLGGAGGMGGGAGGGLGSTGGVNLNAYSQSPYLSQMADGLRTQFTQFMNDGLAANRGGAVQAGGVGGSRAGIQEARTMTDAGKGFDSAIANLYGNDYNNQMNRNLQQYGMDQQNNLGLGGLANQKYGMDQNFYTQQRGQDQSGALIGANLYNQGTQGQWSPLNNANNIYGNYTGFGNTSSNSSQGGGLQGILGGALGAGQLAKNFGWFDGGGTSNSFGGSNSAGWGTGSGFGNQDYGQYF